MSNVIETVTSILEMDKELQTLKMENAFLKEQNTKQNNACDCNHHEISTLDKIAIKFGRKKLFESIFYYFDVRVEAKRKNGDVTYTNFNDWAIENIKYNDERVPVDCTFGEVIEYFREELQEKYKIKCKYAYNCLLEKEKEESEEDE